MYFQALIAIAYVCVPYENLDSSASVHRLEYMKNSIALGITAISLTAGAVALAGLAGAAPTGPSQVADTVRTLEASGYSVIVNRTGAAELSDCTVSGVRRGVTHQTTDVVGSDIEPKIISDVVYVDVAC